MQKYEELDPRFRQTATYHGQPWNSTDNLSMDMSQTGNDKCITGQYMHKPVPLSVSRRDNVQVEPKGCIFRLAEFYLSYAEALNEISYSNLQNSEALVALNAVHTRAGLSPILITELPDQDSFRNAIMLERQQEFPYEGQRWFDLVRMGGAKEAMKAEGHIIQDYQFLYPIPKTELERINNTELLWQNTGY